MATTQNATGERGTPVPQKGVIRPGKLTQEDKRERLDALKIVPQADTIAKLKGMRFHQLVERHKSAAAAEKAGKQEKDEVGKDLVAALGAVGLDAVMNGADKVTIVVGKSAARVDAKLLYQLGVSEETIAKATVMGNEYIYALVTPPKEKAAK